MRELLRTLAVVAEPPGPEIDRFAELLDLPTVPRGWEYNELFLEQLYPYASVYLGPEGMLGGEARDRVAGLWRALGETPPAEPDHLAVLLGLLARLEELEEGAAGGRERRAEGWRRARATLLHEHLLTWVEPWLLRLDEIGPPAYRAWGRVLGEALASLSAHLGPPSEAPPVFREAPLLEEPEEVGGEEFLDQLLAPVRSGIILTRTDLARASRELGIGTRVGERRWVVRAFLQQAPKATLSWVATEARRQADRLEAAAGVHGGFWAGRARRTETLIGGSSTD